jgi:RND family efflux transporter MFP subunit
MKKFKLKPAAAVAIGVLAAGAVAVAPLVPRSRAAPDQKADAPKPALTVTTAQPQAARLPIKLSANGNVTAWQEASIGSESNGLRLTEVRANVGDTVRSGQVLAVFATDAIDADVAIAKASLQEAQATAGEAAANADRARTLQSSGALSAQQISQYLTAEQTANARIAAARATLAAQQLRLKYTRLVAPDGGVISARSATVGAVVGAGVEMFRMIRHGRLEWRAELTSTEMSKLRPGTRALVKGANGSQSNGTVRTIAPTVDAQTRSGLVYVDLPGAVAQTGAGPNNPPFKAGMFASGEFELGTSDAMTVPQQSVAVRDGFSYVFRLNRDQRVSQLKVQTGRRLTDRIEVLGGLTADTLVVVAGAGFLNDGDLVRNVAAASTTPAAGAGAGIKAPTTPAAAPAAAK